MPTVENGQVVITRMYLLPWTLWRGDIHPVDIRAENVTAGLGRVPVGFYVQVDIPDRPSWRTENKSVPVYDRVIQWDDVIHLYGTVKWSSRFCPC